MVDKDNRGSRGYGFVAFHEMQSAQNAMNSLSSAQLAGRPVRLGFAEDRPDRDNATPAAAGPAPGPGQCPTSVLCQ